MDQEAWIKKLGSIMSAIVSPSLLCVLDRSTPALREVGKNKRSRRARSNAEGTFLEGVQRLLREIADEVLYVKCAVEELRAGTSNAFTCDHTTWQQFFAGHWTSGQHYDAADDWEQLQPECGEAKLTTRLCEHAKTNGLVLESVRPGVGDRDVFDDGEVDTADDTSCGLSAPSRAMGEWKVLPDSGWRSFHSRFVDCSPEQGDGCSKKLEQKEEVDARSGVCEFDESLSVDAVQRESSSGDFADQVAGYSDKVEVQVAHSLPDSVYAFSCSYSVEDDATFGDVLRNLHARSNAWSGWSLNNVEGYNDISHIGLLSQHRLKSSLSNEEKRHLLSAEMPIGCQRSFKVGGSGAELTGRTDLEIEIIVKQMSEAHNNRLREILREPLGEYTQARMGGYEKLVLKVRELDRNVAG